MAKVTNAFDTYTATADREDLSNIIYNISPMQTPFMSSIGKRSVKMWCLIGKQKVYQSQLPLVNWKALS